MVILLFLAGALVVVLGIALLIQAVVGLRSLTPPGPRQDGLGDDIRFGIGVNLYP